MSSGELSTSLGRKQMILPHAPEDLIRDAPAECSDGFPFTVAGSSPMLDVIEATSAKSDLGDCDAVQGRVQLAIATSVEAMTFMTSRPNRNGSAPVVHGKASWRFESGDARRLANELGSAEGATSV